MRFFLSLLFAAALLAPASAETANDHITNVGVTNGTNHFIYIDTYEHHGSTKHWGLFAPGDRILIHVSHPGYAFFTDVYVYVKRTRNDDPEFTICTVKKTIGNTGHGKVLEEHVHYKNNVCTIDPA